MKRRLRVRASPHIADREDRPKPLSTGRWVSLWAKPQIGLYTPIHTTAPAYPQSYAQYTTGSVLRVQKTPYIVVTGCAYSLKERPPRVPALGEPSRPPTPAKSAPELTSMETLSIAESI